MLRKIMAAFTLGLVLAGGTVGLSAAACVATDAPSKMACRPGCCADKACCDTAPKRTQAPAQPLARSAPDQQIAIPEITGVALVRPAAIEAHVFSGTECRAHSPPPLELICIRLI
jgi:hypothetical protein